MEHKNKISDKIEEKYKRSNTHNGQVICPYCKKVSSEIKFHPEKFKAKFACGHIRSSAKDTYIYRTNFTKQVWNYLYYYIFNREHTQTNRGLSRDVKGIFGIDIHHTTIRRIRLEGYNQIKDIHLDQIKIEGEVELDEKFIGAQTSKKSNKGKQFSKKYEHIRNNYWNKMGKKPPIIKNTKPKEKAFMITVAQRNTNKKIAFMAPFVAESMKDIYKNHITEYRKHIEMVISKISPKIIYTDSNHEYRKAIEKKWGNGNHKWVNHSKGEFGIYKDKYFISINTVESFNAQINRNLILMKNMSTKNKNLFIKFFSYKISLPEASKKIITNWILN